MLRASQRRQHLDDDPRRRSVPAAVMRLLARSRGDARGEVPTAGRQRRCTLSQQAHIAPRVRGWRRSATRRPLKWRAGRIGVALREEAMSAPRSRLRRASLVGGNAKDE